MRCGGQGIYLWFLARELARLGHASTCWSARPTPTRCPSRARAASCRTSSSGASGSSRTARSCCPRPPRARVRAAQLLRARREPHRLPARALRVQRARAPRARGAAARAASATTSCTTCSASGCGLLGAARARPAGRHDGAPPAHRRSPRFVRARPHPARGARHDGVLPGRHAGVRRAPRSTACSRRRAISARADRARLRRARRERIRMVANGVDTELFRPDPSLPRDRDTSSSASARASRSEQGRAHARRGARAAAGARAAHARRRRPPRQPGAPAGRASSASRTASTITGRVPSTSSSRCTAARRSWWCPRSTRASGLPAAEAMACGTPVVATRGRARCPR